MKNLFIILIAAVLTAGLGGCYKTCEDPFAPNYTLQGSCIDLTAGITGVYNGQLLDSIAGLHSTTSAGTSIVVAKVDDSHVSVSSSAGSFVAFSAAVSASSNGYYLTVPSQTASNGLAVIGAGTYFGIAADGVYTSASKQMIFYALAGTEYEGFTGTQQ